MANHISNQYSKNRINNIIKSYNKIAKKILEVDS